jgi:hypothetical protein
MLNRASPPALTISVSSTRAQTTAWYLQSPSDVTNLWGPFNHCLNHLEPSLPHHANHHRWISPKEPILEDSSCPVYYLVTRPTQGLSFANGNDTTTNSWGQGKSPVVQPIDAVIMDDPFQCTTDKRVDLCINQFQDHIKGTRHDAIREVTVWDPLYHHTVQEPSDGEHESQWQILGGISYQKGEGDADCIYIPPTAHSHSLNIRKEIMCLTHQELAHMDPTNVTNRLKSISSSPPFARMLQISATDTTLARSMQYKPRSLKVSECQCQFQRNLLSPLQWTLLVHYLATRNVTLFL